MRSRFFVLAFLLASLGSSWGQSTQPSSSRSTGVEPPQRAAPDQGVTEKLPLTIKILPADDEGKQSPESEHNRSEKNETDKKVASETQRIADYTWYLAAFTLALCIVTCVFGVAAFITASAAKLSAQAVINAERPHIIMDTLVVSGLNSPVVNGEKKLHYSFQLRNFGRTPSFAKEMALQFYFANELPEGQILKGTPISGVTAPDRRYGVEWPNPILAPADKIASVIAGESKMFIMGFFKYTDVFERPHETHFAYRLVFDAGADASKHFEATEPRSYWIYT